MNDLDFGKKALIGIGSLFGLVILAASFVVGSLFGGMIVKVVM